jgi:hypothetical protein
MISAASTLPVVSTTNLTVAVPCSSFLRDSRGYTRCEQERRSGESAVIFLTEVLASPGSVVAPTADKAVHRRRTALNEPDESKVERSKRAMALGFECTEDA